jgi:Intein splicing domain
VSVWDIISPFILFRRPPAPKPAPAPSAPVGARPVTLKFVLYNLATGRDDVNGILPAIRDALDWQANGEFADAYGGVYQFRVGQSPFDRAKGEIGINIRHTVPAQGAIAYHAVTNGVPDIEMALDLVRSLTTGTECLSSALSHEVLETALDPGANRWATRGDGQTADALEACLTGDTQVQMADGRMIAIQTLAEIGGEHNVLALRDGHVDSCRAVRAHRTAANADIVRVQLSDGSSFRCTPDHKILTERGYVLAGNLVKGVALPAMPKSNASNCSTMQAELLREHASTFVGRSNERGISVTDFSPAAILAEQIPISVHAPLSSGIERVLMCRTEKQVFGPNASWRIAAMAHKLTFDNGPVTPLVRESMGEEDTLTFSNLPVASRIGCTEPKPASVCLVDTSPESLFERGSAVVVGDRPSASGVGRPAPFDTTVMRTAHAFSPKRSRAAVNSTISMHTLSVDSVQPAGKADVYDLTVPSAGNFVIGPGVIVHNCDFAQNTGYAMKNGVWVSNFLLPSVWIPGALGPWDHLGKMKDQYDVSNGYGIQGTIDNVQQIQGRMAKESSNVRFVGSLTDLQRARKSHPYSRATRRGLILPPAAA